MKYRVVGWTCGFDESVEYEESTEGATNAIIDDIKANGYLFTGMDHQGCQNCAPVLNDGKKRLYSDREFGGVMAEAYGGSYLDYAFGFFDELEGGNTPPDSRHFYPDEFVPEQISETYSFELSKKELKGVLASKELRVYDEDALRYIDKGDYVSLKCGERETKYKIEFVYRRKDMTDEELSRFFSGDDSLRKKYYEAKLLVVIELE